MAPFPPSWHALLAGESNKDYFQQLQSFLTAERGEHEVFPADQNTFAALELTAFDQVKVVLLGQDPYHDVGQAHGLAFSVPGGVKPPPSLLNIFKELQTDLGIERPDHGCLIPWARQGVLLLNTVLTVRAHQPYSHRKKGWETFTDTILKRLNERAQPLVFVLWGGPAQGRAELLDASRHQVLKSAHPSPLSARTGFFGSRPFSRINQVLRGWGKAEVDWRLPPANE